MQGKKVNRKKTKKDEELLFGAGDTGEANSIKPGSKRIKKAKKLPKVVKKNDAGAVAAVVPKAKKSSKVGQKAQIPACDKPKAVQSSNILT